MNESPLPVASPGLPTPRRYLAILAVSLGTALAVIDGAIVNVALPTIARDLHVENSEAVLIVTVYQLALVMTLLPFSALGSRIGLRRLYQYGQIAFTIATALCFFAHSLPFLLVLRVIQALGAAAALSVSSAMVRSIYPGNQLGRGIAVNSVVVSVSGAMAPSLGGLVLSLAPWPWLFATAAPLGLLSLLLGHRSLPEPVRRNEPYDVLGAVLCAATFGLTIAGLESAVHGESPVIAAAIVLLGLLVAVMFVRHELRQHEPILPVDLLSRPVLALSSLAALLAFIASMILVLSLPFRLQHHYGFSPSEVGAVITPFPLTMMVVAPVAGILSDRFSPAVLGSLGMAIATAAYLLLGFLPADANHFDIAWRMALCGVGFGMFFAPNSRLIVSSAPITRAASAGGLISTTRLLGQTLGATVVAMLLAMQLGDARMPSLLAATLTVIAAICSLARLNPTLRGLPDRSR